MGLDLVHVPNLDVLHVLEEVQALLLLQHLELLGSLLYHLPLLGLREALLVHLRVALGDVGKHLLDLVLVAGPAREELLKDIAFIPFILLKALRSLDLERRP
eukprot:CAMPEP_0168611450 /NCGR_PEP_ID=MMETSP0449_2-20121227/2366_1 /TAXON_ID=1082188 /ORGANISM="Strombidium rassoulzadegani, Strain ras09" /LENGTH=101 /DNA_ID=CAMNT_0008651901 /DNA_START=1249 /DNA_END=1554 /DNA_ORIENTATION=+